MNQTRKTFKTSCEYILKLNEIINYSFRAVLEEHRKQCEMEGKYVGKYLHIPPESLQREWND